MSVFVEKYVDKGDYQSVKYHLLPLKEIYFTDIFLNTPIGLFGLKPLSIFLMIISGALLIVTCINYINLFNFRGFTRGKEIGIHKVLGANRTQLVIRFFFETIIFSMIGTIIALVLIEISFPTFKSLVSDLYPSSNMLIRRNINFDSLSIQDLFRNILITLSFVIIISGFYPAIILSSAGIVDIMKGGKKKSFSVGFFRMFFLITQFTVAAVTIICAVIFVEQVDYLKSLNKGFDKNSVICIPILDETINQKYEVLKTKLLQHSSILSVSAASMLPASLEHPNIVNIILKNNDKHPINMIYVDKDFFKTLSIKIVHSDNSIETMFNSGSNFVLINQEGQKIIETLNTKGTGINYTDIVRQTI